MQLVCHWVIFLWAVDEVSERVAHLISSHLPPTAVHCVVRAHVPWLEVMMRWGNQAILTSTSCVRLCTLVRWMPWAPAIQAGVVYVRCSLRASVSMSLSPTPPWCSSSKRAVCQVARGPVSDPRVEEVHQNFPLFSVIVKVRSDAEGYLSSSETLLDSFFLLLQLSLG